MRRPLVARNTQAEPVSPPAHLQQQRGEIGGRGRFDANGLAGERVDEAERLGVQRLAGERDARWPQPPGPIDALADDRMTDLGQMNADLVRAPVSSQQARSVASGPNRSSTR